MKPKKRIITQVGYYITGLSVINMWGGGQGEIKMDSTFIPFKELNKTKLLLCVNDGQFGCQSIESALLYIYIEYNNGSREFNREINITYKPHLNLASRGI